MENKLNLLKHNLHFYYNQYYTNSILLGVDIKYLYIQVLQRFSLNVIQIYIFFYNL